MKIFYYPGCTVKTKAKNLEESALSAMKTLDVELVELPSWNCCGTVFGMATDDLVHQLAPIRNLLRVKEQGGERVTTICSMCYNTLKRANHLIREDEEKRRLIADFMSEETIRYEGEVEVLHLLEILRDLVGFETLKEKVKINLKGLKLDPYYGCMLTRPQEIGIDNMENPTILEELLTALGAEVVKDPMKTECCGSYHTVNEVDVVADRGYEILHSALKRGADAMVLSCPLCDYNLDYRQREIAKKYVGFSGIPVFYFSQLLALALGLEAKESRFDLNYVDPLPLLREKRVIV
ncbi:MAG: CoB--CoM heterodisulfide reductase iron-sulfur subunit B family protein [Deltaproteobacteria bacterium]|nr:CoB--CoM heterodisulfide reductase iron-sulfur subunit B family protein [Deltaproteobacteria bacterium]